MIKGTWAIEVLNYEDRDIFDEKVITNMISFNENGIVGLPIIGEHPVSKEDLNGKWSVDFETKNLELITKDQFLNGKFSICFKKNGERGIIIMVLKSEKVYMEAGKVLSFVSDKVTTLPCDG